MGADQSSHRKGPTAQDSVRSKTCYYELLGVQRQATDDEIKRAYRKKALELHPDRNYGDVENATSKFAEIQSAYQVISDPQERAWYDSHRDSILRGDSGGPTEEDHFEHNVRLTSARDIVRLMSRFNPTVPFTDGPNGFYGILRVTFENLAGEEESACDWEGLEPVAYPEFGSSKDDYEDVVKPFYRTWMNFSTNKSFSWRDEYRASDAPDRATRRLVEKENKKLRDEGIREFNDAVRALVAFVRKRDPRFMPNFQTEADRQKILRDAAAAQAARSRAANQAKFDQHIAPEWAKTRPPEEDAFFSDSSESEVEHIECVVCSKTFKSEKQYEAHEKSKKHIKAVQQLQRDMRKEDHRLNLDNQSHSASGAPSEELNKLAFVGTDLEDADELSNQENRFDAKVIIMDDQHPLHVSEGKAQSIELEDDEPEGRAADCSDLDDEYAPREDVESRFADSLSTPSEATKNAASEDSGPIAFATSIVSDDDDNKTPKLGKAKAKRAKKAARQETEVHSGDLGFTCATCNNTFPSKAKLFTHIKDLDHARALPKVGKGKNKKG